MEMLRTLRRAAVIYLLGAATGAYAAYNYEHDHASRLENVAVRGYCAQRDVQGTLYWYSCQDAYIAASLQEHDAETSAIIADMANKQPTKKKK